MGEAGTDQPQRQAKWVDRTDTIEKKITGCSETTNKIKEITRFIQKQAEPRDAVKKDDEENLAKMRTEISQIKTGRGTADNSALTLRLDRLQEQATALGNDLTALLDLIDM